MIKSFRVKNSDMKWETTSSLEGVEIKWNVLLVVTMVSRFTQPMEIIINIKHISWNTEKNKYELGVKFNTQETP